MLVDALSGRAPERLLHRFKSDADGVRLLRERPELLETLSDGARLEAMPEGSLAHAYLQFLRSEGITAQGLVQASDVAPDFGDPDLDWMERRLRDSHDLWHTVTGYRGDIVGEAALLAFTFAQTRNPAVGFVVFGGLLRVPASEARGVVLRGLRRGLSARWLMTADWEALLPLPLETVRHRLAVGPAPDYTEFRSSELGEGGLLDLKEPPAKAA